ncbi:MAG: 50S ribosomal protein L11 methyltransferase [Clostridiales bacterium]|nr:MAG: 50S ribosomal protein L11 methyltransferase [Clostridiales bacterium]
MDWNEIVLKVDNVIAEAAIGILSENGIEGLVIEDESILDDLSRDRNRWDYADESLISFEKGKTVLKGYAGQDRELDLLMSDLRGSLETAIERMGQGKFELKAEPLKNRDWNTEWKKYFKPIKIGKEIIIKPSWESLDEGNPIFSEDSIVIELDPGLAFGTGTHETTRMCLEFIEKHIEKGMKAYDIGCGSGILALAAAKLGASEVLGIDMDGDAVKAAKENVKKNNEEETCIIKQGDLLKDLNEPADLVIANIIFDVVLSLLETAAPFVKKKGLFIVSGILEEKTEEMTNAVDESENFDLIEKKTENGWTAMVLKRRD